MAINLIVLQPLVALIAGILILMIPRLLNIIVAVYLIVVGIAGLWPHVLRQHSPRNERLHPLYRAVRSGCIAQRLSLKV